MQGGETVVVLVVDVDLSSPVCQQPLQGGHVSITTTLREEGYRINLHRCWRSNVYTCMYIETRSTEGAVRGPQYCPFPSIQPEKRSLEGSIEGRGRPLKCFLVLLPSLLDLHAQ